MPPLKLQKRRSLHFFSFITVYKDKSLKWNSKIVFISFFYFSYQKRKRETKKIMMIIFIKKKISRSFSQARERESQNMAFGIISLN